MFENTTGLHSNNLHKEANFGTYVDQLMNSHEYIQVFSEFRSNEIKSLILLLISPNWRKLKINEAYTKIAKEYRALLNQYSHDRLLRLLNLTSLGPLI